ncbi:tripartite tricarboxylate transporter TctB family protein [Arenibaculum pallidiluteum]|uniref:tripartite tricarboxylate transporter TctB family protein n=1 Tax=Arenibaculum pallidiluteum TaxID=2812559 RepID=UPI001A9692F7|nr:tripartite tricarboxylate transporter TctB family protein [Arenibaculum pallidiluteum]
MPPPQMKVPAAGLGIRSPRNFAGGLVLLAIAALALWQIQDLSVGTAMRMGPGYYPRLLAFLLGFFGLVLMAGSVVVHGDGLERWRVKNLVLVLGAIVIFAFAIRTLGLVLSGAALMLVSALASHDLRWREVLLFTAGMLVFSVILFPIALNLPLPIWPRL